MALGNAFKRRDSNNFGRLLILHFLIVHLLVCVPLGREGCFFVFLLF